MKIFKILFLVLCVTVAKAEDPQPDSKEEIKAEIEEDTPVSLEAIGGDRNLTGARPWRAPDFSNQEAALGWSETAFQVPKGMERQVQFWIDIYTKYNTDQGVLHDSENINIIYETLDFSDVTRLKDLTAHQKEKEKVRRVKESKKRVIDLLMRLQNTTDPNLLAAEEKRVWDAFENVHEKNKFKEAAQKGRLRFQLGQKDRIIQGIYFSGRYLEDFEKIFREAGLPMELTRLPFVESSFNVLARSKVGASGVWQIMRYTARPYMMMNNAVDKRNHPIEATKLSSKLLKINFNMLQSWPLAITGYNHGPSGVLKLTKKYNTRELPDLIQNADVAKRFGFASKNFYASFLAVLEVERNAPKYFGKVLWSQPLEGAEVTLTKPMKYQEILKWFEGNDQTAQIFNPQIAKMARQGKVTIPAKAVISVPKTRLEEILCEIRLGHGKDCRRTVEDTSKAPDFSSLHQGSLLPPDKIPTSPQSLDQVQK